MFSLAALALSPPGQANVGRREAMIVGLSSLGAVLPAPAFAQRSALIPKSSKESTESFKAYQLSAPKYKEGEGSAAFKAAEEKRKSAGLKPGGAGKEETAEETMRYGPPAAWPRLTRAH